MTNPGVGFSGKAVAGTGATAHPIVGASVQVYAAGTTGNGSAGSALLTNAVSTDTSGAFTIPSGYSCPATTSQLYVIVRGGQVGTGAVNPAITLATVLGTCAALVSNSQFVINEVTTAATGWGLSQFLGAGGNVGATSTNAQGLANAVATVENLVNPQTGTSPGTTLPSSSVSPAAKIDSFANLLNTCTAASSSSGCAALFSAAMPPGGTAPTNTLDAALTVVRSPGSGVAALYTQSTASTAFAPALTSAPADWTMAINYTGGGMKGPTSLGVDSKGDVWVAGYYGVVSEFSPTGNAVVANGITGGGLNESFGLAVDAQDNVWISNEATPSSINSGLGSVTVLNSAGQVISGTNGFTAGGIAYPLAIAIDTNATAWVADNYNARVTLLSSTGQSLSGTQGYASTQLAFVDDVAIDASHNGWVTNSEANPGSVTKISPDGSQFTSYACCVGPAGLAIDQRGYVWVANYYGDSISQLSSAGAVISAGYSDNKASISHPNSIAIDGAGRVWIANYTGSSITELAGSAANSPGQILSPTAGYAADSGLNAAYGIVVDASGNLWITNFYNNVLTEIVGLATPVKTPQLGPVQTP